MRPWVSAGTRRDPGLRPLSRRPTTSATLGARQRRRKEPAWNVPIIELNGVVKSFGPVSVLKGVDLKALPRQGHRARRRQRRRQVDPHQGPRRRAALRRRRACASTGSRSPCTRRATRRGSASRSCTRTSRSATTSTSCRTCSSVARRREFGTFDEGRMEREASDTLRSLSVRTVKSVRQKVSSLSGGQRQTVAIARAVLKKARGRHPRRADRGPRRRADRAGAQPREAPRRAGRRRHHHQPQPRRRVRGRRPHQRALPRADGRVARRRARPRATTSSATSPAPRRTQGATA